jgi:hypothetical protein
MQEREQSSSFHGCPWIGMVRKSFSTISSSYLQRLCLLTLILCWSVFIPSSEAHLRTSSTRKPFSYRPKNLLFRQLVMTTGNPSNDSDTSFLATSSRPEAAAAAAAPSSSSLLAAAAVQPSSSQRPNPSSLTRKQSIVQPFDPIYLYSSLIGGVCSGTFSSVLCAPLDLIRTRMQVWGTVTGNRPSIPQMIREIVQKEGWKGCFRGLGATLVTVPAFWGVYCE